MSIIARLLAVGLAVAPGLAVGQVSNMPQNVQDRLREVGPGWGKDIRGNVEKTLEVYAPVLAAAPKAGVKVTKEVPYGSDARHRLDLYQPLNASQKAPVVIYFHGGAYVRGERNVNAEIYGNIPTWFARQGIVGVNATYRLAPVAKWPAAAQDVGAVVKWVKDNASQIGADPNRVFVIGQSAGATHVASYAFMKDLQPIEGHGVAGLVLISGRYEIDPAPDDPNLGNVQAYFGPDRTRYPNQSPLNFVKNGPKFPIFIAISEYDNPDLDTQGALLLAALCQRDRACPRFTRMEKHNHLSAVYQFNTPDEAFAKEVLAFIERGR